MERKQKVDLEGLLTANKQRYLITTILNKDFDPEVFTEYISSKKENGGLIENWSLEELIIHVENFTRLPHIFFPKNHSYSLASNFNKLVIQIEGPEDFNMIVDEDTNAIKRKQADIKLLLHLFNKEFPSIQIPQNWQFSVDKSKPLLEWFYALNSCLISPVLKAFFNLSEKDFFLFKTVF